MLTSIWGRGQGIEFLHRFGQVSFCQCNTTRAVLTMISATHEEDVAASAVVVVVAIATPKTANPNPKPRTLTPKPPDPEALNP